MSRAAEAAAALRAEFNVTRHELDDHGSVSPSCDVEAAVRRYRWRVENDVWPKYQVPERVAA